MNAQLLHCSFSLGIELQWGLCVLLSFGHEYSGQPSLLELPQHIARADTMPDDTQLAALAAACTNCLSERAQIHELRAAQAAAPSAAASVSSITSAAPIAPHIGSNSKPQPPLTFRAVLM